MSKSMRMSLFRLRLLPSERQIACVTNKTKSFEPAIGLVNPVWNELYMIHLLYQVQNRADVIVLLSRRILLL
jgi:hypothetical protein